MREIKFRGKRIDTGEWVYGYYSQIPEPSMGAMIYASTDEYIACEDTKPCIIRIFQRQHPYFSNANPICVVESEICEVDPATVGQYTSLKDKNGTEIYEGDVVAMGDGNVPSYVFWSDRDAGWMAHNIPRNEDYCLGRHVKRFIGKIIGNVYESPNYKYCGHQGGDQDA